MMYDCRIVIVFGVGLFEVCFTELWAQQLHNQISDKSGKWKIIKNTVLVFSVAEIL